MRRFLLAALGAATLAASLFGRQVLPAGADTPPVADLEVVSNIGSPTEVSPPGGIVVYHIKARNNGPAPALADLTDLTTGGTYVAADSHLPAGCSAPTSGNEVDCEFTLIPGTPAVEIDVAIQTPTTAGPITNTATISVAPADPLDVVDGIPGNNVKAVTTAVANDPNKSGSLVQAGGTLRYQQSVLTNTGTSSVIVTLSTAPGGSCGGTKLCNDGLRVEFDSDPDYAGHVQIDVSFGSGDPCRGLGAPKCFSLYVRKGSTTPTPIQNCGPSADPMLPCLDAVYKVGSNFHWVVEMDSDDPDLIPLKF